MPGAHSPSQVTPQHKPSFAPQPSPLARKVKSTDELDAGEQLEDRSLAGVRVTQDELLQLVADLGLGGADADDLVKGLSFGSTEEPTVVVEPEVAPSTTEPVKADTSEETATASPVKADAAPTEASGDDKTVETTAKES